MSDLNLDDYQLFEGDLDDYLNNLMQIEYSRLRALTLPTLQAVDINSFVQEFVDSNNLYIPTFQPSDISATRPTDTAYERPKRRANSRLGKQARGFVTTFAVNFQGNAQFFDYVSKGRFIFERDVFGLIVGNQLRMKYAIPQRGGKTNLAETKESFDDDLNWISAYLKLNEDIMQQAIGRFKATCSAILRETIDSHEHTENTFALLGIELKELDDNSVDNTLSVDTASTFDPTQLIDIDDIIQHVESQIWILECEETASQGTAFHLSDVGLVTCAHVLGTKTHAINPKTLKRYPVRVIKKIDTIDLALIEIDLDLDNGLERGNSINVRTGDKVAVFGFPNYRVGDSVQRHAGDVTGIRTRHAVRRILTDAHIISGNSGGPALNLAGQVIGIAVTGSGREEEAPSTEDHGIIAVEAVFHIS